MLDMTDWQRLEVRTGTVVRAEPNRAARRASISLWIDFGSRGVLQSSAQLTDLYQPDELIGTQVVAVTGFEPKRVAGFRSDVLVLGATTAEGVVLVRPDRTVAPGSAVA